MTIYYAFLLFTIAAGGGLLVRWLALTELGTKALDSIRPRRNFMPYYFPFAVFFGWLILTSLGSNLADSLTSDMMGWEQKFTLYSVFVAVEIIAVIFILMSARKYFEDGLYGFGIRFREIFRDIAVAAANFITVWPLSFISLYIVVLIGRFFIGDSFAMEKNEGLVVLLEYKQLSLRILMVFFAAGLTPVFEELVFRGLLQSYIRGLDYGPWQSIFAVSVVFAALHPLMHFPAIFILSVCMGYAYEKSGSILRPIFIHFFFNALTITFALLT